MDKKNGSPCSALFLLPILGLVGYIIYVVIQEFSGPNGQQNFLMLLKGFGICLGAIILGLVVFYLVALISSRTRKTEVVRAGQDYLVRCDSFGLSPNEAAKNAELAEDRTTMTVEVPVFLLLANTNQGLRFSPYPVDNPSFAIPTDNDRRYQDMFLGRADPVILPAAGCFMYFRRHQKGDQCYVEAEPMYIPGQYGELSPDIGDERITIVITNTSIMDEKQPFPPVYQSRQVGVMFTLVALNDEGEEDPALTRKLYCEIYDWIKPRPDTSYEDYYGY